MSLPDASYGNLRFRFAGQLRLTLDSGVVSSKAIKTPGVSWASAQQCGCRGGPAVVLVLTFSFGPFSRRFVLNRRQGLFREGVLDRGLDWARNAVPYLPSRPTFAHSALVHSLACRSSCLNASLGSPQIWSDRLGKGVVLFVGYGGNFLVYTLLACALHWKRSSSLVLQG